ncbi:MAG: SDR family NAD(P)-dependent oxidoreductase [Acidimicrobiales bacterium]
MPLADAVDSILEVPIVTSFTRIGYDVRSRLDRWRPLSSYDLDGRVVLITGATSGLGLAAARQLARCGATLLLLGRDAAKTESVRDQLVGLTGNSRIRTIIADMGDLEAVRRAATLVLEEDGPLHALVHNAGALHTTRATSPDGIEATVASQVLGPFLLTTLLLPRLRESRPARVITTSSGGMYGAGLEVEHLEMTANYRGAKQYAIAKRAQVTLNEMWATRGHDVGVVFHAMHPGWADTPGIEASLPRFHRIVGPLLRTPEQGADTLVWLVADDGAPMTSTGKFWLDRRPRSLHKLAKTRRTDTPQQRSRLWAWCVEHSGVEPST